MDCPNFQETNLSEWSEVLVAPLKGGRYPLSGVFELTDRCNLGCVHCYINQPAASREIKSRELSTDQIKQILDQIADAGCLFLLLTGGEILLRPDFPEIYRYVHQKGILVTVFTNGSLITPRIADLFAEHRPRSIEITLYGATPETYEKVTQVEGSYARCMQGIQLLLKRNIKLNLKSVLITRNLPELEQMKNLAKELGVKYRYDSLLWPRLDGCKEPQSFQIPIEQMVEIDFSEPDRRQEWERVAGMFFNQNVRSEYVYSCGAGLRSFHIDSYGKMSICTMSRCPTFDLLTMTFQEGWEQLGRLREMKRHSDTPCRTCTLGGLCSQCPGWSQAVHNDDETPVDFVCQLAHQRAQQIDMHLMINQGD